MPSRRRSAPSRTTASLTASPLTMSLAAALVVYSLVQAVGLTLRMRALA